MKNTNQVKQMPRGQKQQKILKHMKKQDDMDNPSPSIQIKRSEETQYLEQQIKELKMNNETMAQDIKDMKKTLEEHKKEFARVNFKNSRSYGNKRHLIKLKIFLRHIRADLKG